MSTLGIGAACSYAASYVYQSYKAVEAKVIWFDHEVMILTASYLPHPYASIAERAFKSLPITLAILYGSFLPLCFTAVQLLFLPLEKSAKAMYDGLGFVCSFLTMTLLPGVITRQYSAVSLVIMLLCTGVLFVIANLYNKKM
jgi:hypothetical protein